MDSPLSAYRAMESYLKKGSIIDKEITLLIGKCFADSVHDLLTLEKRVLTSRVPGKTYTSFIRNGRVSRAINISLWRPTWESWEEFCQCLEKRDFESLGVEEINTTLYSVVISFCAWCDLFADSRKTPGTFFERFIANIVGRVLDCEPKKSLRVLSFDADDVNLPTDLIFDLGIKLPKYHVPVKTSTRERAIQVWAHQRVIDGVFGTTRVLGTPVLLTETKVDSKKFEVVEICTPMQWQLFQSHISQLLRIYYLDVPAKYEELNTASVKIRVQPFGRFFIEFRDLLVS